MYDMYTRYTLKPYPSKKCKRFGPYQPLTLWISENHSTALVITPPFQPLTTRSARSFVATSAAPVRIWATPPWRWAKFRRVGGKNPGNLRQTFRVFFCLEKEGNLADISSLFLFGKGRGRKVGRDCVRCSTWIIVETRCHFFEHHIFPAVSAPLEK